MTNLQWEWIQSFVVVAQNGSLSKAATVLNASQPTLSRHIIALEQKLGICLFDRSTQGLKLTRDGKKLVESSEAMQQAADSFARIASGATDSLSGDIRISANEIIGLYYLPKIIASFNQLYPKVTVEIVISNKATSLNKRDADIALRMFRPTQPDLIAKRLPNIQLQLTASKSYLDQHGTPKTLAEICNSPIIGFDQDLQMKNAVQEMDVHLSDLNIINKTDFLPLQIELIRANAGIGITHQPLIAQFTDLQPILLDMTIPSLEFWLVCHADVQHNRKIRIMMDFLTDEFSSQ